MKQESDSQFTKTGFSKAGFACCGHWQYCDLGKGSCFYSEIDPEVKNYCACYLRHRNIRLPQDLQQQAQVEEKKEEDMQLSLF